MSERSGSVVAPTAPSRPRGRTSQKTAALLARRIVGEIVDGGLQEGALLPTEREMAAAYGVARGTLREALRFLEIQGVITLKTGPRGGPVVEGRGSWHLAGTLAMMLQLDGITFGAALEAQLLLGPALARRAAAHASPDDLRPLRDCVARMEAALDDGERFAAEVAAFHDTVGETAGNPVFSLVHRSLHWLVDGAGLVSAYPRELRVVALRDHERICAAIVSGDPEGAAAAMTMHVADHLAHLAERRRELLDAPLRWDRIGG